MTDRPLYTTMNLTTEHSAWITATIERLAALTKDEMLVVRAVHFHHWLGFDEDRWNYRHDDMHTAALAAGLAIRGGGYTTPDGTPVILPPEPFLGLDPDLAVTACAHATTVLWHAPAAQNDPTYRPSITERQVTLTALSAILAVTLDAYSWTWWTCNLRDGDTPATVTRRALGQMIEDGALHMDREWTLADLKDAHDRWSRTGMNPAVDGDHLLEAALAAGLKLRVTYQEFSFIQ